MVLGETEFRHQVESTIRPFRDVLLGLFFVAIGMLINPAQIPEIWYLALAGAVLLMVVKAVLVALILRFYSKAELLTAWRTGWLLAVGGEFGFAILAIALTDGVIDARTSQIALTSVLFAMIFAPFLIRFNHGLARLCCLPFRKKVPVTDNSSALVISCDLSKHVILCGYGHSGQAIGRFLQEDQIPFAALDINPIALAECPLRGTQAFYGDATERDMLEAVGIGKACLVVITFDDTDAVYRCLHHIRALNPDVPVMIDTQEESNMDAFKAAGATEVIPKNLESNLMLAAHTLILLGMPMPKVLKRLQQQWRDNYPLLNELLQEQSEKEGKAP